MKRTQFGSFSFASRQEYYHCRKQERSLNKCVFDKMVRCLLSAVLDNTLTIALTKGLAKTIPGSPPSQKQIHEVEKPIFKGIQK
jgi:NADH dehydrogenase (ubiquinone) 1 alpha subcomplex subunit 8